MKLTKLFSPLLFIVLCNLAGCMDLAATQRNALKWEQKFPYKGEIYTMRGFGGIFSTGMNRLEDTFAQHYHIRTASTIWYKAAGLSDFIIKHYRSKELQGPLILIGHSLGANEQIRVAKYLNQAHIPVDLLITIDAVAPYRVPPNVREVLNIYKPGFVPMLSGLTVRAIDPQHTRVENLNVNRLKGFYVNHFTIDKKPEIQKIMLDRVLAVIQKANRKKIQRT